MRLWKLRLVNFIGIYNGCGRDEITIDFSKCQNNIVVIKGDNGSGKSTLFKALNPFSDPSNALIPGRNAAKFISYILQDNTIIHIEYHYKTTPTGTRTSTCHVIKEMPGIPPTDLNPNGNVKDAKEIICNLFDIDSGVMTLAQLSSDDRGLADKTPSERKKYINSKISELDAFNDIYKKISKKSTSLKSILNTITTKLDAIGDTRIIQTNINQLEVQHKAMDDHKIELNVKITEASKELEELKGSLGDALEARSKLGSIRSQIKMIEEKTNGEVFTDGGLAKLKGDNQVREAKKEAIVNDIVELNSRRSKINDDIMAKQVQLDSLSDDESIETIQNQISDLKRSKEMVDTRFREIGFIKYEDVSVDEYKYAIDTIEKLQDLSQSLINRYDDDVVYDRMAKIVTNQASSTEFSIDGLESFKTEISNLESKLNEHYKLEKVAEGYDNIPKDCNNLDSCFFIKDIVEAKNKLLSPEIVSELESRLKLTREEMLLYKEQLDIQTKALTGVADATAFLSLIKSSIKIITKFPVTLKFSDEYMLLTVLYSTGGNVDLDIDIRPYREYQNIFIESKTYQKDIDELEKQLMTISSSSSLVVQLRKDIEKLREEYSNLSKTIEEKNQESRLIETDIDIYNSRIDQYEENLSIYNSSLELKDEEIKLNDIVTKSDDKYNKTMDLESNLTKWKNELYQLNQFEIPGIQNQIQKFKFALNQFEEYSMEYAGYSEEFNKVETIKKYCSPTTGIQTLFMEMYMNKVIGVANSLLSMLFGGEFVLQPFVVNEKEFKMPVLGSGILNDDISSMSTSQICMISMILSFALLHESSRTYNIIKIDELEGGLDTQNRLAFFGVLQNLMQVLMFEQCVMISHNAELNMGFMDVIVLRNSDPTNNYKEGNVIFEL